MKITGIEFDAVHVNHRGDWVFVHVLTDCGYSRGGRDAFGEKLRGATVGFARPRRSRYRMRSEKN